MNSGQQVAHSRMGPSRSGPGGGMVHSSSSSGIFFQGDGRSQQPLGNFHLGSFGNSANSMPGNVRSNMVHLSGDVPSSGPSVGASSLVTDANSGLSGGGPRLQRSASINTESYTRLPASPLSFSSNNVSISSPIIDGQTAVQQNHPSQDPHPHQVQPQGPQGPRQGASTPTPTPLHPPRLGQVSPHPNGSTVSGSFMSDHENVSHLQKKPRLDMKADEMMPQQVFQQMLQRQDSMQLQSPNPQLQALIQQQQQQRLRQQQQQQQMLQSLPPVHRAHLLQQQQQQLQLRQLQQQGLQPNSGVKRPYDGGGVCSRRLMQYLYHQRQRPADNGIAYWKKFVTEYYSPRAKKRWCLSLYDNVGHHSLGVFPQAAMDAWQCDICGSKSGRGFEATFEVLPRLNEIKFGSGVIDELLFVDLPRECRFPSGIMMLEYGKAVQESVYEQLRVVREGQLKVLFTPDLKILTWEFCARRHEELLPRRLVAPQVNQLLQVAQKCQSTIADSGSEGVSQQDLQTNSNMVVMAGRQLARSLELQSLNDLGFSKRYVRCLQISEVVNSMKDLMDICRETKSGPIDGLKNFPRAKQLTEKPPEMENGSGLQGVSTDRTGISNVGAMNRGGSAQAALTLSSYQNMLMRQNSMSSNSQQEASSFNHPNPNPNQNGSLQGWANGNGGGGGGFNNPHLRSVTGMFQQQNHPNPPLSQGGQQQQQMIQQLLQDMNTTTTGGGAAGGGGPPKPSLSGQSTASGMRYGGMTSLPATTPPATAAAARSNSFKAASHSDSAGGGKAPPPPEVAAHFSEDIVGDIASEFFNNDELDDTMGYGWKA